MITEGIGDLLHRLNTTPERVPSAIALAAGPTPAEILQPAAAGTALLRDEASAACAGVAVIYALDEIILGGVGKRLARLLRPLLGIAGGTEQIRARGYGYRIGTVAVVHCVFNVPGAGSQVVVVEVVIGTHVAPGGFRSTVEYVGV